MNKLPKDASSVLPVAQTATLDELMYRNLEVEQILNQLQPLLYALSVKLYKDNNETITLQKLIEDAIKFLDEDRVKETIQ